MQLVDIVVRKVGIVKVPSGNGRLLFSSEEEEFPFGETSTLKEKWLAMLN